MSEGLEAIAMAALAQLQSTKTESEDRDQQQELSDSPKVKDDDEETKEECLSRYLPTQPSQQTAVTGNSNLETPLFLQQRDNSNSLSAAIATAIREASSPAVVSSTSQEEGEELKPPPPAGRVVSYESMVSTTTANSSAVSVLPPQPDVADQVLAVLRLSSSDIKSAADSLSDISKDPQSASTSSPPSSLLRSPPPKLPLSSTTPSSKETEDFFANILADPEQFLIESEPHFSSSLNKTIDRRAVVADGVRPNDVLCGRGGETNHHAGNIQYRLLVKAYRGLYVQSTRRIKPKIAQCIVFAVRQVGGRFLKRAEGENGETHSDDGSSNTTSNACWKDVGNVKAREKTSQALREGAPDLRSTTTGSVAMRQDAPSAPTGVPGASAPSNGIMETKSSSFVPGSIPPAGYGSTIPSQQGSSTAPNLGSPFQAATSMITQNNSSMPTGQSLMNHPLFHSLPPFQQQQIVMEELQAAREAAASAEYAAMRHYHYQQQQQQQQPYGQGGGGNNNKSTGYDSRYLHGEYEIGSVAESKAPEDVREKMLLQRMNPKQLLGLTNGDHRFVGQHPGLLQQQESQLKRVADAMTLASLSQPSADSDKDTKENASCRGPRLKRLKLRRELEA